mmetsp:Transcript_8368/g.14099  ORF Transcript_8368/g.14099 Transcript_8368/m.14099 type:complete len:192 (-) Transcript_8368:127-702(-)
MSFTECCRQQDGFSDNSDDLTSFIVSQMGANKKLPRAAVHQIRNNSRSFLRKRLTSHHDEREDFGRHRDASSNAKKNQKSDPETAEVHLKVEKCAEDHGTAMASLMSNLKLPLEAIEIRHSIPEAPQQDDVQSWGDSRRTRDCCYRRRRRVKAANEDRDAVGPETRARSITYTEQVTEIKISRVEQSWTLA